MIGCGGDNQPIRIVHGGAQRGARRCAERCTEVRGGVWRYTEGCAEVHGGVCRGARRCAEVRRGVHRGARRGVRRGAEVCGGVWQRWLPLATIDLVGDNREFEV